MLVIDKPSGLLSVPGKAETHKDSVELRLKTRDPDVRLVHRLDVGTSGIMVFAKTPYAQRHLGLQFEKRQTEKEYVARAYGRVTGHSGYINLPIATDWPNRPRQMVDFERGRSAQTHWQVDSGNGDETRLRLHPITGRSHQLRVHLNAIGYPILGDRIYAHEDAFSAADRLQLHAERLRLRHPLGGDWVEFTSPAPF